MIEVCNLAKKYGSKSAVDNISFTIEQGEIVGFLGPNGAGKSTTMNIITGYLSANAGSVKINGIDVLENPIAAKKQIGYLPEQPPLYTDMTVKEYLGFVYELKKVNLENREQHIDDICAQVGIENVFNRIIKNLSKGYKQRVGMAAALIGDPMVLILDEPTVGLDPIQIIEIRNVIKKLGEKRTVILSSHILPEVQAVCERVLVLNSGKIVADNTPEKLNDNLAGVHRIAVRIKAKEHAAESLIKGLECVTSCSCSGEKEPGVFEFYIESEPQKDIRESLFFALAKSGYPLLSLKTMDMSLEDIFLKLTTDEIQTEDDAIDTPQEPTEQDTDVTAEVEPKEEN